MIKRVLQNIFNKDSMNYILPIFLIQLVLFVGMYNLLRPNLKRRPCSVCGRANTNNKKVYWEYKTGFLKVKKIPYCKIHITKAPKIIREIPSDKDQVIKRYWMVFFAGFMFFLCTIYSLALFEISFVFLVSVPVIQVLLFFFKGMVTDFSITTLFICFVSAPVFFYYLWIKIESGILKLK